MDARTPHLLFTLLRAAVCGTPLTDAQKAAFSETICAEIQTLAEHHDVAHLAAYALDANGLSPQNAAYSKALFEAIYRYEQSLYVLDTAREVLSAAAIPFIPLKGAVLRAYYPEPWMRTSVDVDILVTPETVDRGAEALVANGGCTQAYKGSHDIPLLAANGVHLELHYTLLEDVPAGNAAALQNVWSYAIPQADRPYEYALPDEWFYAYHIAHIAKHILDGGCGIRPLLDLWLLDTAADNRKKRDALLKECGLQKFAAVVRQLSRVWFDDAETDAVCDRLAAYILRGGNNGSVENRLAVQTQKHGSRAGFFLSRLTLPHDRLILQYPALQKHPRLAQLRYIFTRIFAPYNLLKLNYPILQKHPWLTPLIQVKRWWRLLFAHNRNDRPINLLDSIGL